MRRCNWPPKNPQTQETYEYDWGEYLAAGETIVASAAVTASGSDVVVQGTVMVGAVQQVTLSGGTLRAAAHVVILSIATSAGNTPQRRVRIKIRER